jgi:hypothetical protein
MSRGSASRWVGRKKLTYRQSYGDIVAAILVKTAAVLVAIGFCDLTGFV